MTNKQLEKLGILPVGGEYKGIYSVPVEDSDTIEIHIDKGDTWTTIFGKILDEGYKEGKYEGEEHIRNSIKSILEIF